MITHYIGVWDALGCAFRGPRLYDRKIALLEVSQKKMHKTNGGVASLVFLFLPSA